MRPEDGRIAEHPSMRSFKMTRKFLSTGIAIVVVVSLTGPVFAGANDYVFEPVKAEVKKGDDVVVSVRLKHKATGKPVTDAVIVQTRIDMSPDAMGEMASPLTPVPSNEPGVYSFKTDLSMQGRWLLSIAAKVQGEAETVVGKITFRATR
jgi:YtkA-like